MILRESGGRDATGNTLPEGEALDVRKEGISPFFGVKIELVRVLTVGRCWNLRVAMETQLLRERGEGLQTSVSCGPRNIVQWLPTIEEDALLRHLKGSTQRRESRHSCTEWRVEESEASTQG